jgi:4-hydroxythreonine-4-phosphate dehydrogenase
VRDAALHLRGRPISGDLRALLARAGLPATHLPGASPAALRAAVAAGARALVCDASTDADLDRIARAGLALRPRPLFVGSAGLARALARTLPRRRGAPSPKPPARPVLTVVGSASAVSQRQAEALRAGDPLVRVEWRRAPGVRDIPKIRRLGRFLAHAAPEVHYVLTGGETARAVLGAREIRALRLLGEVEPGVPFGMARDGTLVCTKAGAFGSQGTLARCVARLTKEMRR